jgi:hypothetical protein
LWPQDNDSPQESQTSEDELSTLLQFQKNGPKKRRMSGVSTITSESRVTSSHVESTLEIER